MIVWLVRTATRRNPKGSRRRTDWPHIFRYCKQCGQKKPLTAFYKNPTVALGHEAVCKDCRI